MKTVKKFFISYIKLCYVYLNSVNQSCCSSLKVNQSVNVEWPLRNGN